MKGLFLLRCCTCAALNLLIIVSICAQSTPDNYSPRKTHSEQSYALIGKLQQNVKEERKRVSTLMAKNYYNKLSAGLIEEVNKKKFIDDDSMQLVVENVLARILKTNKITHKPTVVLIMKSPTVNAFCVGEGTLVITVGMLSRIHDESHLAYTLSHEVAHYELDHVKLDILKEVDDKMSAKISKEFGRIINDDKSATSQDIDSLKELVYRESEYSRVREIQADSLGFIFLKNAGYPVAASMALLSVLDSARLPRVRMDGELFAAFQFSKYPFQDQWLKPRPSFYQRKSNTTIFSFSTDSLRSHPEVALRQSALLPYLANTPLSYPYQPSPGFQDLVMNAGFETIESAYFAHQYDLAIYLSLEMLTLHPGNDYPKSMICRIFIELCDKKEEPFESYVSPYTGHYHDGWRKVNNFLFAITKEEVGEIAFHFLNHKSNFNPSNKEHYYLLWKICDLTGRKEVEKKIKQAYSERFGDDNYFRKMSRQPIQLPKMLR